MVFAAFLFCFGTVRVHDAHASSTTAPSSTSSMPTQTQVVQASRSASILSPSSLDQIVDRYVRDHMFDDDTYDPVESTYREAYEDQVRGSHPKALREITSSVLGSGAVKAENRDVGFGAFLVKTATFLKRKGLSEVQAIYLITGSMVIGTPIIVFGVVAYLAAWNKRKLERELKGRYGQSYTVDATIKVEDDVELPDDDDDDDDDDEDDEVE